MRYCIVLLFALMLSMACVPAIAQQSQGLSLAIAQPLLPDKITATGRIRALTCAQISPRVSGHLLEMGTGEDNQPLDVGMVVKAGQVLFRLNETTFRNAVAIAEAQMCSAKANLDNLTAPTRAERMEQLRQGLAELDARLADRQREHTRYKRLVEEEKTLPARRLEEVQTELAALQAQRQAASARLAEAEHGPTPTEVAVAQARVREAEAALKIAQNDLCDATLKAPFSGVITQRFRGPGDYLPSMPPTTVLELVATDKLEADLCLPEAYLSAIQAGKTRVALHSTLLKAPLMLPVSRIVSAIDAASGTFTVRIAVPADRCSELVPGAFITADVQMDNQARGVIIPLRAIHQGDTQVSVFVAENGKMARRTVVLGDRLTESAVVQSGLTPGDQVIVGPAEAMADGTLLPDYLKSAK